MISIAADISVPLIGPVKRAKADGFMGVPNSPGCNGAGAPTASGAAFGQQGDALRRNPQKQRLTLQAH